MNRILPVIISGFIVAVFSIVPILKNFSCCLFLPFASVFSLYLDLRVNKNLEFIRIPKALKFGFLTGLFATIFYVPLDLLITFFTRTNDFIAVIPQAEILIQDLEIKEITKDSMSMIRAMAEQIKETGFSPLYAVMILFSNLFTNSIFGMIGGLIGMGILNKKITDYSE